MIFTNPISEKHAACAAGVRAIKAAVDSILPLYFEDDSLNDTQPLSFAKVIPMSLDEWSLELGACADDWDESALAFERAVQAHKEESDVREQAAARALCEAFGFSVEVIGGGANAMTRANPGGGHAMITCDDGGGMPSANDFMACFYPRGSDGSSEVATIRSGGAVTLLQALGAMATLCEAGQ